MPVTFNEALETAKGLIMEEDKKALAQLAKDLKPILEDDLLYKMHPIYVSENMYKQLVKYNVIGRKHEKP